MLTPRIQPGDSSESEPDFLIGSSSSSDESDASASSCSSSSKSSSAARSASSSRGGASDHKQPDNDNDHLSFNGLYSPPEPMIIPLLSEQDFFQTHNDRDIQLYKRCSTMRRRRALEKFSRERAGVDEDTPVKWKGEQSGKSPKVQVESQKAKSANERDRSEGKRRNLDGKNQKKSKPQVKKRVREEIEGDDSYVIEEVKHEDLDLQFTIINGWTISRTKHPEIP